MTVERCNKCWCCSTCVQECDGECSQRQESEDELCLRVLGIDFDSEDIRRARDIRKALVREEIERFRDVALDSDSESSEDSDNVSD